MHVHISELLSAVESCPEAPFYRFSSRAAVPYPEVITYSEFLAHVTHSAATWAPVIKKCKVNVGEVVSVWFVVMRM
jgi:hypothetical protein